MGIFLKNKVFNSIPCTAYERILEVQQEVFSASTEILQDIL
jgi:hypothetical protein